MSQKKKRLSKEAKELNDKLIELSKTTKTKPKEIKNNDRIQLYLINDKTSSIIICIIFDLLGL